MTESQRVKLGYRADELLGPAKAFKKGLRAFRLPSIEIHRMVAKERQALDLILNVAQGGDACVSEEKSAHVPAREKGTAVGVGSASTNGEANRVVFAQASQAALILAAFRPVRPTPLYQKLAHILVSGVLVNL